jgi:ABC-type Zn2+ transport system substrate-binding protein/surface adhesin
LATWPNIVGAHPDVKSWFVAKNRDALVVFLQQCVEEQAGNEDAQAIGSPTGEQIGRANVDEEEHEEEHDEEHEEHEHEEEHEEHEHEEEQEEEIGEDMELVNEDVQIPIERREIGEPFAAMVPPQRPEVQTHAQKERTPREVANEV